MKRMILFSILMLFAGVVSALGNTSKNDCDCGAAQEASSNGKLVDSQEIMKGFEQGQSRVKVIVNLAKPLQVLAAVDWNSTTSLNELHAEILARQKQVLDTLSDVEFTLRHRFENQAGFSGEVTLEALEKLIDDPCVVSIEPVYILEKHLAQGIPLINGMVYRSTYNGQGVAIAICDDGIDYNHPKLGSGSFPNSKVIGGYDFGDSDADPFPSCYSAHGTCCAGIAAGDLGTTGDYIGGVAYGAKLYALKVEDSSGSIYVDNIIAAWDWCVNHKNDNPSYPILVISTSLGGGRYFSMCDSSESAFATAANNAVAAGITLPVSSGNEGYCDSISSPACLSNTISVGAVYDAAIGTYSFCVNDGSCATPGGSASCDPDEFSTLQVTAADLVAVYSNTASFLDVLAPADDAYTTDIYGACGYSTGDYYYYFGGTSAACPYAAGTVACLQSAAKEGTGSYLSPSEVRSILTSTGDNITDSKVVITKPRINLGQAIDSIIGGGCQEEYPSTDVPKIIPDPGTTTSTLDIVDTGTIVDLNVKLNITHTWDSDLDVYLIAPDGTRVELFTDVGSSGDNFSNTILDDEASIAITSGSAPFDGPYQPEGNLSDFDGKSITGTWTLEITDDAGADSGTLTSWSLVLEIPCDDCCPTTITSYPYTESFESDFGDWGNAEGDDIDWTRHSGSTPSTATGPSSAYDGTYYLYTEASGSGYPNKQAMLEGPCFDLSSLSNPELWFCYHMYGAAMGTLSVEISDDNCSSWTTVWSLFGDQGNSWYEAVIDLSAYSGSTVKVRFVGVTGSSYTSDTAIDYITVGEGELDAPVLHAEPNITPRLCNTIYWDPVADANDYYAECANDANFANIDANSGWITDTNYEFCGLTSGQIYSYRVKARTAPSVETWLQTSQVEFQSDTLIDTAATSGGDVVLVGGSTILFNDDFEDGDMIGWMTGSGSYTREVTNATAAAGSLYSITLIGGSSSHHDGVSHNLAAITPDDITFYVRSSDTSRSDGYFVVGTGPGFNTQTAVFFHTKSNGQMGVYDGTTFWGTSYTSLTWHKIRFAFNWMSKEIDYYVNDSLVKSGITFRSTSVSSLTKVYLYNYSDSQAWWDEIEFSGGSADYTSPGTIISTQIDLLVDGSWGDVNFSKTTPANTSLTVDVLDASDDSVILADVASGTELSGIAATSTKLRANLATSDSAVTPALHDWSVTYTDPSGACESDWSNVESSRQCGTPGDFEPDCDVDWLDLATLVDNWLRDDCGIPDWCAGADLDLSTEVDFFDFGDFAQYWFEGVGP